MASKDRHETRRNADELHQTARGDAAPMTTQQGAIVPHGLGMARLPKAARPAGPVNTDLPASDPLSILKNGPDSFAGRKVGALVIGDAGAFVSACRQLRFWDRDGA